MAETPPGPRTSLEDRRTRIDPRLESAVGLGPELEGSRPPSSPSLAPVVRNPRSPTTPTNTIDGISEIGDAFEAFTAALGNLPPLLENGIEGFGNLNRFATEINSNLTQFAANLTGAINGILSPVQQAILETTAAIESGIGGFVSNVDAVAGQIASNIGSTIDSIVAQVPVIGQIGNFATQLNSSLANVSGAINNIGGTITGISGVITGATTGISQSINNIGGAISGITGAGTGAAAGLSRAVGGVTGRIGGAISGLSAPFDNITQTVTQFNGRLTQGLERITGRIANVTNTIDTVSTLLTNPGAIIEAKINQLVDAGIARIMEPINQLVNFGYNLASQINSVASIITQEITNLTEFIGGIFTGITTLLSGALNSSDFYQENNLSYADGEIIKTENGPKLLSPLRKFNHYNYIITLGILEPEEYNFPSNYRNGGFKRVIVQSGGGSYDRRVRTLEEGAKNMEYHIEDLEIDAVVAPNQNTGVTLGTTISFKIIEPYSMGKFIEAIVLGAEEAGYQQYMQAPFCIKIDFVGWNETGDRPLRIQRPKYVPIMFTKMDFDVTEQGSTYTVNAVAYSEHALSNNVNQSLENIEAAGRTVAEVLETSADSVGRSLSSRIEYLEQEGQIQGGDRYIICFPKTKTALYQAAQGIGTTGENLTRTSGEEIATQTGSEESEVQPDDPDAETEVEVLYSSSPQTYQRLKAWAQDEANLNVIGKSPVWDDARATDRAPHASAATAYDSENQLFNRQYAEVQTEGRTRLYDWHEGTRVTDMIEDVLMTSSYILDAPSEERDIPFFKWFRIETMVFIEPDSAAESENGTTRKTYVYAVHPYFPDEAKLIGPGEAPTGNDDLKRKALKEYNYIYSGKNEDILEFNLNFNQAFYQNILANFYQGTETGQNQQTSPEDRAGSRMTDRTTSSTAGAEISAMANHVTETDPGPVSSPYEAGDSGVRRRIAESVHQTIINSPYNMVTAEMEIWGDPYFIPTEQGNYSSEPAGPSLTQDSTMNYMQNEVLCVVNFKTPLDYPINGFVMNMPELVRPFSGVFQIWAVTNKFYEGKFTQTLKLLRRQNQNAEPTGTRGAVVPNEENTLVPLPSGGAGLPSGSIGYGIGQVDPRLASAAGIGPQLAGSRPVIPSVGYGIGQVDPRLAQAARSRPVIPSVGYGIGQVDPRLTQGVVDRSSLSRLPSPRIGPTTSIEPRFRGTTGQAQRPLTGNGFQNLFGDNPIPENPVVPRDPEIRSLPPTSSRSRSVLI